MAERTSTFSDSLSGLAFQQSQFISVNQSSSRKDLYLASSQIFPTLEDSEVHKRPLTRLQERLIKKLGANAFPFFFELPPHCPASVTLQPAPGDTGHSFIFRRNVKFTT